ncbi:MAG TPA: arylsulfotransferase family protein [Polyangiaceae bacterium]|nr:arylsulfotransferase family protein [Polyangiaceae bacterium]
MLCALSCSYCSGGGTPNNPPTSSEETSSQEPTSSIGGSDELDGTESTGGRVGSGGAAPEHTGGSSGGDPSGSGGKTHLGSGGELGNVQGDRCSFNVESAQSQGTGTVTIVNWSTDFDDVTAAHIEFGPTDAELNMIAPVDVMDEQMRTLLLGMKANHAYQFRIVVENGDQTCVSPKFDVTTLPLPDWVPIITKTTEQAGGVQGFYVTTPGITFGDRKTPGAYVFDTDGDVVWYSPQVRHTSAAQMSWDGQTMWYVDANGGNLNKTSMDGLTTEQLDVWTNHDLVPLPEGGVAVFSIQDQQNYLLEVADDGTVSETAHLEDFLEVPQGLHPNALMYYPADDSFTISDLSANAFIKVSRSGELLWQLGGSDPRGNFFELVGLEPWSGNHGHDWGPQGQFLFFNNFGTDGTSHVLELELDEDSWTASYVQDYKLASTCQYLGGTERLPNGHTSIVHAMEATIDEVDDAGNLIQRFDNSYSFEHDQSSYWTLFGYAHFRPTLYGPPPNHWPAE